MLQRPVQQQEMQRGGLLFLETAAALSVGLQLARKECLGVVGRFVKNAAGLLVQSAFLFHATVECAAPTCVGE